LPAAAPAGIYSIGKAGLADFFSAAAAADRRKKYQLSLINPRDGIVL